MTGHAKRLCKNTFIRPSSPDAMSQPIAFNAHTFGPLGHSFGYSVQRQNSVSPTIATLLFGCCPSTVLWTVRSIVVNAINAMLLRWTLAHVRKKVRKGDFPTLAQYDASTAVVRVRWIIRVVTPSSHVHPNSMLGRTCSPVSNTTVRELFSVNTPTTMRVPSNSFSADNNDRVPAVACAQPSCKSLFVSSVTLKYDKPSESLSSQVFHSWGYHSRITFNHDGITFPDWPEQPTGYNQRAVRILPGMHSTSILIGRFQCPSL